ncbi:MAG: DNA replication complex subunit Gins51 [Promethearchaeota archaeon]
MNLKTDYQNLYQHWLKEFKQSDLTPLSQENFDYYRKSVDYITKFELEGKHNVEIQLLKSYKYGFKYLFNDFLKIREVKLLNAALVLQEIDYNNVFEAEKLFYQKLISAIKGFKKLKTLVLYEEDQPIELNKVLEDEKVSVEPSREESPAKEVSKSTEGDIEQDTSVYIQPEQAAQYKYTLIRFTKPSPPLVGIDLINYGPFQENDIANMPYKNAKILIYEKLAEKIDVT